VIRDGRAVSTDGGAEAAIELAEARDLASAGVLVVERDVVRPTAEAQGWLKRRLLEADDSFAAQHRSETVSADGTRMNLAESPLSRLATAARGDAAFLARHQVEAGERVRQLAERACLQPRITMNYSAAQVAGSKGMGHAAELGEMAADARRQLAQIHRVLPRDCAGVVLDVCGLLKGLQTVEQERGWPRRSAKLVLRIGLEQLAQHYGIAAEAVGAESRQRRVWLDEGARPERFD
jgi:hypothetical protein